MRIIFVPVHFMKKGIAAILLVFYFAFSSGVVINLHYCMSRFDSSKLGAAKSEVCSKCGMHTKDADGCCHDEVKLIKIQDDQQTAAFSFSFTPPDAAVDNTSFFTGQIIKSESKSFSLTDHSPPLSKQDTYLINCVFRI